MMALFTWATIRGHRRTDPMCEYHHGRTPARSRGKWCLKCYPPRTTQPTGEYGPRTYVAVVGYAAARHLPELPVGMVWALEYVPDSTFALWLYRDGRRTVLGAMGPLCELRTETVIVMARNLNKRRIYAEGNTR